MDTLKASSVPLADENAMAAAASFDCVTFTTAQLVNCECQVDKVHQKNSRTIGAVAPATYSLPSREMGVVGSRLSSLGYSALSSTESLEHRYLHSLHLPPPPPPPNSPHLPTPALTSPPITPHHISSHRTRVFVCACMGVNSFEVACDLDPLTGARTPCFVNNTVCEQEVASRQTCLLHEEECVQIASKVRRSVTSRC